MSQSGVETNPLVLFCLSPLPSWVISPVLQVEAAFFAVESFKSDEFSEFLGVESSVVESSVESLALDELSGIFEVESSVLCEVLESEFCGFWSP